MSRIPGLAPPVAPLSEIWTDNTLVANNGNKVSPWVSVTSVDRLRAMRATTAGNYSLEIDWSRDGETVDAVQTVAVGNNAGVEILVFAPFARFRILNTDALAAFTSHRTNVFGR